VVGTTIASPNARYLQYRVMLSTSDPAQTPEVQQVDVSFTTCSDGILNGGEQCDQGAANGTSGSCCNADCTLKSASAVCRAAAGECDLAETCAGSGGACPVDAFKANGTSCNDGNACTTNDICSFGQCAGAPDTHQIRCDDHNPCTDDGCSPTSGCVHINNTVSCNDGNACSSNDKCSGGSCVAGAATNCDDANPCTDDSCSAPSGCAHTNVADATQCTSATGVAGVCATGSCCTPALGGVTGGIPSGLLNAIEQPCPSCPRSITTHTKYVKCVKSMAKVMRSYRVITTKQQKAINKAAQQASVGH
jgi:hypothetical protein